MGGTQEDFYRNLSVYYDGQDSSERLNELKGQIRALGSVNVSAIEEYKEVSERYEFFRSQIEDVEKSKTELTRLQRQFEAIMEGKLAVYVEGGRLCVGER